MLIKDVLRKIESKYSTQLAYEWDNVGLIIGDENERVNKILVSLEATEDVIKEAIKENVDLIITHHPFLFKGIKNIKKSTYKGNCIYNLIKNNISLYSMHTNFDISVDGLNDYFCEILGFDNLQILDKINQCEGSANQQGIGRIISLDEYVSFETLLNTVKTKFSIDNLRFVGDVDNEIKKIAVVTGSGSEYMDKASSMGANLLITGDIKYHDAQTVLELGMNAIDIGHFESENIFCDVMKRYLDSILEDVKIIKSSVNINPFKHI